MLISSWLNTRKYPVVGNEQRSGAFWKRIAAYFAATPKIAGSEHMEANHCNYVDTRSMILLASFVERMKLQPEREVAIKTRMMFSN